MTSERFIYYMHDELPVFRFRLTGDLSELHTSELDQARETASSVLAGRPLIVDLTAIGSLDRAGRELMTMWQGLGAQLLVTTQEAKARMESMTSMPIRLLEKNRSSRWTRCATAMFAPAATLAMLLMLTESLQ